MFIEFKEGLTLHREWKLLLPTDSHSTADSLDTDLTQLIV